MAQRLYNCLITHKAPGKKLATRKVLKPQKINHNIQKKISLSVHKPNQTEPNRCLCQIREKIKARNRREILESSSGRHKKVSSSKFSQRKNKKRVKDDGGRTLCFFALQISGVILIAYCVWTFWMARKWVRVNLFIFCFLFLYIFFFLQATSLAYFLPGYPVEGLSCFCCGAHAICLKWPPLPPLPVFPFPRVKTAETTHPTQPALLRVKKA